MSLLAQVMHKLSLQHEVQHVSFVFVCGPAGSRMAVFDSPRPDGFAEGQDVVPQPSRARAGKAPVFVAPGVLEKFPLLESGRLRFFFSQNATHNAISSDSGRNA